MLESAVVHHDACSMRHTPEAIRFCRRLLRGMLLSISGGLCRANAHAGSALTAGLSV